MIVSNENTYFNSMGGINGTGYIPGQTVVYNDSLFNTISKGSKAIAILLSLFIMLWIIAGTSAFTMSVVCFKFGGSGAQKISGFLLALLLGPFYWLFYFLSSTYCK
jgi:hypothetical protein